MEMEAEFLFRNPFAEQFCSDMPFWVPFEQLVRSSVKLGGKPGQME